MTGTSSGIVLVRLGAGLLGFALVVSSWASPDPMAGSVSVILTVAGIVLTFVATGRRTSGLFRRVAPGHIAAFFVVATAVALLTTLFTSRWPAYKLSWLNGVYSSLPSIRSLPYSWAQEGLQPNQTGGFLAVSCAMMAAMALFPWQDSPESDRELPHGWRWVATSLFVAGVGVVFLTGSRAALAAVLASTLLLLVLRTRRWLWVWGLALVSGSLGMYASGYLGTLFAFFLRDETLDTKLVARLDIWTSALLGIQDHLFTGIGLGVFNQVMPVRYPYETVSLAHPVSQAHNLFLDVTLALGMMGALGLGMLLLGTLLLALAMSRDRSVSGVVSLGVTASLTAFLVFGVTDSISLSVPTSFVIWIWAFSVVIMHRRSPLERRDDSRVYLC